MSPVLYVNKPMVIVYCIHKIVLDVGESKANKTDEVPAP